MPTIHGAELMVMGSAGERARPARRLILSSSRRRPERRLIKIAQGSAVCGCAISFQALQHSGTSHGALGVPL
ncbi:hypothetical protein BDW22DRAFT_117606 [Trametopsis cervina]|nr:hypothetical protein BDW22DRAFT_117606 [Trametopsis cervina]